MKSLHAGVNLEGAKVGVGVNMAVLAAALATSKPAALPEPARCDPMGSPGGQQKRYGNRIVVEDGYTFQSVKEARRYRVLKSLAAHGVITGLEVHPVYELRVNGELVYTYTADFRYVDTGRIVVEDVKGRGPAMKETFRVVRKLFAALYGTEITVPGGGVRKGQGR